MVFIKIFQYSDSKQIRRKNEKRRTEFILKNSLLHCGAVSYENEFVVTQTKDQYAIYECAFIQANGVDKETDEQNQRKMNEVIKSLDGKFKIYFLPQRKNNLDENISYYEKRVQEETNIGLKERMLERIEVMRFHNSMKYSTMFFFVEKQCIDDFERKAMNVLHIQRRSEKETMELLRKLNNDLE